MRDGGKGDKRRPLVIPEEQFNAQWDLIYKKKPEPEPIPFAGMVAVEDEYHTPED